MSAADASGCRQDYRPRYFSGWVSRSTRSASRAYFAVWIFVACRRMTLAHLKKDPMVVGLFASTMIAAMNLENLSSMEAV
jgi:hypothetical protein